MYLLMCEAPKPDELWQGYVMRLAVMNGFLSLDKFENKYLYGIKRNKRTAMMYPESLALVCDRMSVHKSFPTVEKALLMTPYFAEADALTEGKQAKSFEAIFYNINEPVTPNVRTTKKFQFHICPECMKRDKEKYGHWYFHLSHHFPSVTVCTEHKVPLLRLGRFDKRVCCTPKLEKTEAFSVDDMEEALAHAEAMKEAHKRNQGMLILKRCPDCGKEYPIHPYSDRTGAGCPYCRDTGSWEGFIQRRLEIIHGAEYRLTGAFTRLSEAVVKHVPCGMEKRNLQQLLWDKRGMCSGCKAMTVSRMQKQIDPEKKEFIIRKIYRNKNGSRMVKVTHLKCGKTFDVHPKLFQETPLCRFCARKKWQKDSSRIHRDYRIVSEYQNNRDAVLFQHLECGCIFQTSKTSFLAGTRCPVCSNHYDFSMVEAAVSECAKGYTVEKAEKRGDVNVYYMGEEMLSDISYSRIMNDLQEDEPKLIKNRTKKYVPPRSIRRKIYDSVAEGTREKGFWEGADGIDGEEYTRRYRNILQDLANQGFIERIEKGKYRTACFRHECREDGKEGEARDDVPA